ncbi:MAG TPA: cellulase family glycosylhydrolase [Steroidobacteraceae bacterium]|nr:cellulase family glycosylhydrolase [Steroidobacteraceae bacterium]
MSNVLRALRRASILCTLLLLPVASFAGFSVSNGQLVDNNGTPFVMRGINYPYTWFQSRPTQQDFAAMAATGANTVRLVLSTGGQWPRVTGAQVSQLIQWAKDNRMIAVLEVHDSTGWTESTPAVPISNATAYWLSSDIRAAINGQENFVIINIANEPFGNTTTANYTPDTITAIRALRNAGVTHTLMVDAANWGQDWSNTMRTNAMTIWNADTRRNLVFSVHMYEVYAQASAVSTYMQAFDDMALPLVVGEFGADHQGQPVDEAAIMSQAQQRGNGYIGWSWSGNGGCCVSLDIVNNFGTTLSSWGQILINGPNGIRATSVVASVFGTPTNNLTVSPTSLSFASGASSLPVAVTANVSWTVTDNQTWITASPVSGSNNGSISVSVTANTGTAARTGTVTVTGGGLTRTVAVTQAGTSTTTTLNVSTTSLSLASGASSGSFSITSNVAWTVTDDQTWLTATPASGSNNATVTVNATANSATTSRTGTVTVTGGGLTRTVSVTQAGSGGTGGTCPNPITFSGNTGNFNTTGAVCYRTNSNINGWGCFNFDGRTVTVGGVARTCGQMPLTRSADGYYYFAVTAGQFPWAGMYSW